MGGGYSLYFWIELIKTIEEHVLNVGDSWTVKKLRCEGVGAKGCGVAIPEVAIFNVIYIIWQNNE